jgi:hypothetical protein
MAESVPYQGRRTTQSSQRLRWFQGGDVCCGDAPSISAGSAASELIAGSDDGFSLVEVVVSTALMLVVTAAVFTLTDPARGLSAVQLESTDMQQHLRVAADTLAADLAMAGAGSYSGAQSGALTQWLAPVMPYRQGAVGADPPGTYRSDTITLLYVPATSAQTTLTSALAPGQLTLRVNQESGCPLHQELCGFTPGMTLLVYDKFGNADTFTLTSTTGTSGRLAINSRTGALQTDYAIGSKVVQIVQRTYYRKTNASLGIDQLVYYDGSTNAAVAVADHVVGLEFEYYGDPQPPVLIRPVDDPAGPWTTYGPRPPGSGLTPTAYPAGENCTFAIDPGSGSHVARLAVLGGDPARRALVRLSAAELADGDVWCPDDNPATRFDADLLRIRKVAVTLRVESAIDALRGPAGVLFKRGGTARDARRFLPDREVRFQVTPPNLQGGN